MLVGRQDALTPVDLSQEIAAAIPGAKLEIVEDCGHLSTMEQPDAVNRALRAWLQRDVIPGSAIARSWDPGATTARRDDGLGPGSSLALPAGDDGIYSSCSQRAETPPMTPPRMGATQNSHSWLKAAVPPNIALPRLRAGLTEALEIGMAMMWMAASVAPTAIGANPAGRGGWSRP